jgi:thiol-disulfide isomerase/thioredoxin
MMSVPVNPGVKVTPVTRSTRRCMASTALLGLALLSGCGAGLGVGDPAPPLAVSKWLRGDPVASLQVGKTYVIEFWASWCPPCKASIPHLTELQKKYPKVVFIGVNVWEKEGPAKGEAFAKSQGDAMGYRVAQDDVSAGLDKGKMALTWLKAAKQNGIPCAFVVNDDGKIAWIGHPMDPGMVKALEGMK